MSRTLFSPLAVLALLAANAPVSAQIVIGDQFNPSPSGGLCGLGVDPTTGNIWVYPCSGATIDGYTSAGTFLASIARPGAAANDVDIEFAPEELTLNTTTVPQGTLLFINGESGVADIYAVDPGTGVVLDILVTGFGNSHVVGGGYDPVRNVFFLVQDRVPSGALGNLVAEIDPVTGVVLNSFSIETDFDVNFGDLDVSSSTGNLFVVSSAETGLGEFTPAGDFVAMHALPAGVTGLSGLGLECGAQEAWVANTSGVVWRLASAPCGSASAVESTEGNRFALQPNFPDPFTSETSIRFSLARPSSVRLTVHDVRGHRVRTLVDGSLPVGPQTAVWNGRDESGRPLPSGAYFYHLTADGVTVTQSAVLLR